MLAAQNQVRGKPIRGGVGQQARRRDVSCPKASSREAKYSRSWAASAEKRYRLPKIMPAGCLLNKEMGCIRGVKGGGCPKFCSRDAYYLKYWVAYAAKRGRLPKSKLAGSQILEKLGSKRGEEVPVVQNQVRGKSNTREVG